PRDDTAAVRAAAAIARLAVQGPPRPTPVMQAFLRGVADHVEAEAARMLRALASEDPRVGETSLEATCDPISARVIRALLRDTISPNIVHAGVKYNVIPGEATVELDCRVLPGTTEDDMREIIVGRLGDLAQHVDVGLVIHAPPVAAPVDDPLYGLLERTVVDHDPDGVPLPIMVPFATDAKHTAPRPHAGSGSLSATSCSDEGSSRTQSSPWRCSTRRSSAEARTCSTIATSSTVWMCTERSRAAVSSSSLGSAGRAARWRGSPGRRPPSRPGPVRPAAC